MTASNFHNLPCKNMEPVDIILKSALMFNGVIQKSVSIDSGGLMGNTLVMIHWVTALFHFIFLYWHMLILLHTECWVGIMQQQLLKQIVYLAHHYSYLVWMSYTLIWHAPWHHNGCHGALSCKIIKVSLITRRSHTHACVCARTHTHTHTHTTNLCWSPIFAYNRVYNGDSFIKFYDCVICSPQKWI